MINVHACAEAETTLHTYNETVIRLFVIAVTTWRILKAGTIIKPFNDKLDSFGLHACVHAYMVHTHVLTYVHALSILISCLTLETVTRPTMPV